MKSIKKIITLGAIVLIVGVTSVTAFAATMYKTPAEAVAGLTGKTVENVIAERQETNKTYGAIAAEAGKLNEFKKENIEIKKENLKAKVAEKTMTREKADAIIKTIEERQKSCDGTGFEKANQRKGARFGQHGKGQGGRRLQDGSCGTLAN